MRYDWLQEERGINDDLTFKPPFYRGRDTKKNVNGTYDYDGDRCDAPFCSSSTIRFPILQFLSTRE